MSTEPDSEDLALLELEQDLRERLRIDPAGLQDEFLRCPANIALIAARHAKAIGENLRAKIRSKKLWGLMMMQAREDLEAANDSAQTLEDTGAEKEKRKAKDVRVRITESMVESRAHQMPAWVDAQENEVVSEVVRETAKGNLAAIMAKKDCLVQLGASARAELERDPVVRDRLRVQRGE